MNGSSADIKRQAIIDALADGKRLTTREVMEAIGQPRNNTATFLNELARKGRIRRVANYDGSRESRWALPLDAAQNMESDSVVGSPCSPTRNVSPS